MNALSDISGRAEPATVHRFDEIEAWLTEAENRVTLFTDARFATALEQRLDRMTAGRQVLSLDVFDTLLLRDRSAEITRFLEIATRMAEIAGIRLGREIRAVDALVARHLGTQATYRAAPMAQGCREGSLRDLHRIASRLLGDGGLADAFVAAELDVEQARTAPNTLLAAYAARFRAAGGRVVLITDMYMHAEQVADLLERHGIGRGHYDRLFSSANHAVSKASGLIFPLVEAALGCGPGDVLHAGDSLTADFAQPVRRGWAGLHLPLGRAEIAARRADHDATMRTLADAHGLRLDVARPL